MYIGFCCGAYAAIRVGVELGAARVLAFSPQADTYVYRRANEAISTHGAPKGFWVRRNFLRINSWLIVFYSNLNSVGGPWRPTNRKYKHPEYETARGGYGRLVARLLHNIYIYTYYNIT